MCSELTAIGRVSTYQISNLSVKYNEEVKKMLANESQARKLDKPPNQDKDGFSKLLCISPCLYINIGVKSRC
jgi:hypothetical protein